MKKFFTSHNRNMLLFDVIFLALLITAEVIMNQQFTYLAAGATVILMLFIILLFLELKINQHERLLKDSEEEKY